MSGELSRWVDLGYPPAPVPACTICHALVVNVLPHYEAMHPEVLEGDQP